MRISPVFCGRSALSALRWCASGSISLCEDATRTACDAADHTQPHHDEPQPDIAPAKPPAARYRTRPPEPQDILLLVEVADTSLRVDRDLKLGVYASSGIPEVWLIDLAHVEISRHRRPNAGRYQESETLSDLAAVAVPRLRGVFVDLSRLL
jgi:Uma2 family endonuclease